MVKVRATDETEIETDTLATKEELAIWQAKQTELQTQLEAAQTALANLTPQGNLTPEAEARIMALENKLTQTRKKTGSLFNRLKKRRAEPGAEDPVDPIINPEPGTENPPPRRRQKAWV